MENKIRIFNIYYSRFLFQKRIEEKQEKVFKRYVFLDQKILVWIIKVNDREIDLDKYLRCFGFVKIEIQQYMLRKVCVKYLFFMGNVLYLWMIEQYFLYCEINLILNRDFNIWLNCQL